MYCRKNQQNIINNTHVEPQWTQCVLCRRSFCIVAFQSWNEMDQHQSSGYHPAAWCSYVFADFQETGFAFCTRCSISIWEDWLRWSYSLFSRILSICSVTLKQAWGRRRCREWPHRSPAGQESSLVCLLSRGQERTGHHGSLKKNTKNTKDKINLSFNLRLRLQFSFLHLPCKSRKESHSFSSITGDQGNGI